MGIVDDKRVIKSFSAGKSFNAHLDISSEDATYVGEETNCRVCEKNRESGAEDRE
jgi:hypothetical protein